MRWVAAASFSSAVFLAIQGTFLPLRRPNGVEYLFVWPGDVAWTVSSIVIFAGLAALYVAVIARARRLGPLQTTAAREGRWLAPVAAVGVLSLGVLPALPVIGERGAVVAYFLYDLRWWWVTVIVATTAWRIDDLLGRPIRRRVAAIAQWPAITRQQGIESVLFVGVIAWAIVSMPGVRFTGDLYGDEPKYVRYCETWYQGGGCDVSQKQLLADLPPDAPSHVGRNFMLLGHAVVDDAHALGRDLVAWSHDPVGFRWNRASGSNQFLTGWRGTGMYQLHQPGFSLILFPGYFVDRHLPHLRRGYQGEFPRRLVWTNVALLLTYGCCAIALFRLLRRALNADALASAASALAMMTLPIAAFPFQLYPEMPAALLVIVGCNYVWFGARDPVTARARWPAFVAGASIAFLTWTHPRFLLLSIVLAGIGAYRSTGAARRTLLIVWTSMLVAVGAYNYHVTGSWMPDALYAASTDMVAFVPSQVVDNLISYVLHGNLGLVPNAPWVAAVLPGLAVLFRRDRDAALFVAAIGLALGVPAAGHALHAAGGTPGRFVVAVVPLMIWPVAVLVHHARHSSVSRWIVVVVSVLSLDAAWSYNRLMMKGSGMMVGRGLSGWKPNLVFPHIREHFAEPSQPGFVLFLVISALLALWTALALRSGSRERQVAGNPWPVLTAWVVGG